MGFLNTYIRKIIATYIYFHVNTVLPIDFILGITGRVCKAISWHTGLAAMPTGVGYCGPLSVAVVVAIMSCTI